MNKQIWVSVISLVTMTCFMIFTTILYFKKSSMINNAQIFNSEYTDMGFELKDSKIYANSLESDPEKYSQKETYLFALELKYKEQEAHTLRVLMNFESVDFSKYNNLKINYTILDKDKKEIVPLTELDLLNKKATLYEKKVTYNENNYLFYVGLEFITIVNNTSFESSAELGNTLSAELDYNS